jgi:uncharacterized protein YceK
MRSILLTLAICAMLSLTGCSKEPTASSSSEPAAGAKASVTSPASTDMQAKVCKRLKQIVPKLGHVASVQAVLVVEIADEFDYSPEVLSQVKDKIDEVAISGCATERQSILAVLKMASLQDAVR